MRLYTIYYLCKNNIKVVENSICKNVVNTNKYRVNNWTELNKSLEVLYPIDCLQDIINKIYKMVPIEFRYLNYIDYDSPNSAAFNDLIKILTSNINTIVNLYEALGYDNNENNLEVKIPNSLGLDELSDLTNDLHIILTQSPYIDRESGNGKIIKSDVGSIWLILCGTTAFLTAVGYMVSVTIKAKADLVSIKQSEAMLKEMNLKAEILSEVKDGFKKHKEVIMDKYLSELNEKTGKTLKDGDEHGKAEMCIEKLDKWMEKGMQIYAAIDTPREIQVLFPEQPDLKNISGNITKLIEDKSE